MRGLCHGIFALMVLLTAPSQAQAPSSSQDDSVRRLLGLALDNIQKGLCENNQPCAPATADERANPPLTLSEAKAVVARGVISAMAERCGLDWRRLNYLPMMAHWRNSLKSPERKLTLIGLLHGVTQGQIEQALAKRGPCSDAERRQIEISLPFRA